MVGLRALMGFPGPSEWVLIFLVFFVSLGGVALPTMARNMAKGFRAMEIQHGIDRPRLSALDEAEHFKSLELQDRIRTK